MPGNVVTSQSPKLKSLSLGCDAERDKEINQKKNLYAELDPGQAEVPPSLTPERKYKITGTGSSLPGVGKIIRTAVTNSRLVLSASSQAVIL